MAGLTEVQNQITRFSENEKRVDVFANDRDQIGFYETNTTPQKKVETLPHFMGRVDSKLSLVDDAVMRAEQAAQLAELATYVKNSRLSWVAANPIATGQIINIPSEYYPGRDMIILAHNGELCDKVRAGYTFKKPYSEIGEINSDTPSKQLKIEFEVEAGDVLSIWVIASNAVKMSQAVQDAYDAIRLIPGLTQEAKDAAAQAKLYAEQAQAVTGIEIASRIQFGIVKIGEGINVVDGVISVNIPTLVSTPQLEFPQVVALDFPTELRMSASTAAPDGHIVKFYIQFPGQPQVTVDAVNDGATYTVSLTGQEEVPLQVSVWAEDDAENISKTAKLTYILREIIIGAPKVTAPANGAVDRPLDNITVNIQAASIDGTLDYADQTNIQLSKNANFSTLVEEYDGAYTMSWILGRLDLMTTYYIRARHHFQQFGWGLYGQVSSFTTLNAQVNSPQIISPTHESISIPLKPEIVLSAFSNVGPIDTSESTNIQISKAQNFATVEQEYNSLYLTSWTLTANLDLQTAYFVRARHKGITWGWSAWSAITKFTTTDASLGPIAITSPANSAVDLILTPEIVTNTPTVQGQTILSKQVQVATVSDFATTTWNSGEVAWSNTTTIGTTLAKSTVYYARVRARASITDWGAWSSTISFTTQAAGINDSWSYSSNATFTAPAAGKYTLEVAGGGGGGIKSGEYCNNWGVTGGAGGYAKSTNISLTKGQQVSITVGGGGAIGNGRDCMTQYFAKPGGTSSIAGYISATGGTGFWWDTDSENNCANCMSGDDGGGVGGNANNSNTGNRAKNSDGSVGYAKLTYTGA